MENRRTGVLGRLQSNRKAVESVGSGIVRDSRSTNSIWPVARAAVFVSLISVDPNVIERGDSSLVALMSSVLVMIGNVQAPGCSRTSKILFNWIMVQFR